MARTIIIVGGALSGPTAAARARETDESARIVLLERNTRVSYALTGLSLYLSGEVKSLDDLNRERAEFFASVYNIEVRTGCEVTALDAAAKTLRVRSAGKEEDLKYDSVVFASGAASLEPPGIPDAVNHSAFRTLDDLAKIDEALRAGRRRFVILGGGPMGIEAADGLIRAGADVTIVEKSNRILPGFSALFSRLAARSIEKKARIAAGAVETGFETKDGRITAVNAGARIETDFVISAIGVRPRSEVLQKAGAKLEADASVVVDEYCRTSLPDVFACGVGIALPRAGARFLPQAAAADRSAQTAGANAAGASVRLEQIAGAMLLRMPDVEIGKTGMTWKEASDAGKGVSRVLVHVMDKESYMPGADPAVLQLVFEKGSGRVLGLEAIGHSLARRLDAAGAAIVGGLSVHELAGLDSAYHPSSGAVRDALMVAATVASQAERGMTRFIDPLELSGDPGKYLVLDAGKAAETVHLHIPLEQLRGRIGEVQEALLRSGAKVVAALSETGRRGHLAERILAHHGIEAVNVQGGKRLFSEIV